VITGGASGIGRALDERFATEGLRVVLADIEEAPLQAVEQTVRELGAQAMAVRTDVADPHSVESLAYATIDRFGAVHIVCNHAGVWPIVGPVWQIPISDWKWVLGVNVLGVINGIRAFAPILLRQGTEAHIVNTASVFAVLAYPYVGP